MLPSCSRRPYGPIDAQGEARMLDQTAFAIPTAATYAGQLDPGFADSGKAWVDFVGSRTSLVTGLTIDHAGRILVAARIDTAQGSRFGLARLHHEDRKSTRLNSSH